MDFAVAPLDTRSDLAYCQTRASVTRCAYVQVTRSLMAEIPQRVAFCKQRLSQADKLLRLGGEVKVSLAADGLAGVFTMLLRPVPHDKHIAVAWVQSYSGTTGCFLLTELLTIRKWYGACRRTRA